MNSLLEAPDRIGLTGNLTPSLFSSSASAPINISVSPMFQKEEQEVVEQLFQRFATLTGRRLSAHLNTDVLASMAGLEAVSVDNLNEQNPFHFIELQEGEPAALIQCDLELACLLLEVSLGGTPADDRVEPHALTPLEARIFSPCMSLLGDELQAVWPIKGQAALNVDPVEKRRISSIFSNYSLMAARIKITLFNVTAALRVVIPMHMLRAICQLFDAQPHPAIASTGQYVDAIREALAPSALSLTAEIEVFRAALADMANLQPDDVLVGTVRLDAPLTVKVNGVAKYEAHALVQDGVRAIQLIRLDSRPAH